MDPRPAAASRSVLVRWMGIKDANHAGSVHVRVEAERAAAGGP
jgi:hypothetical protein